MHKFMLTVGHYFIFSHVRNKIIFKIYSRLHFSAGQNPYPVQLLSCKLGHAGNPGGRGGSESRLWRPTWPLLVPVQTVLVAGLHLRGARRKGRRGRLSSATALLHVCGKHATTSSRTSMSDCTRRRYALDCLRKSDRIQRQRQAKPLAYGCDSCEKA